MKQLILVRHAKSSWDNPNWQDFERPLNQRGEKNAPLMGKRLRKRGIRPERILSSPAKRARETARLLARQLTIPEAALVFKDRIYLAGTETLLELVRTLPAELDCVMLVGHNPGLTEFANLLSDTGFDNLPTCAVVGLELTIDSWTEAAPGRARRWFYETPKHSAPPIGPATGSRT